MLRAFIVNGVEVWQAKSWKLGNWQSCSVAVLFQLGQLFLGKLSHHFDDASDQASAAGEMKGRVAVVVSDITRRSTVDEQSYDGWLVGDDGKVERGLAELEVLKVKQRSCTAGSGNDQIHDGIHVSTDHRQVELSVHITMIITKNYYYYYYYYYKICIAHKFKRAHSNTN